MSRHFHIGDILSVTTGILLAPAGIAAMYELLDYMTGDANFTHQLPRVADECKPHLLAQHPDLADIEVPTEWPDPVEESVNAYVSALAEEYGEFREVKPLEPGTHQRVDPLAELLTMRPDADVIVVEVGESS